MASPTITQLSAHGDHASHEAEGAAVEAADVLRAFPAIGLCGLNVFVTEKDHMKHYHRPEYKPYEYLHVRSKRYPWGDGNHTLFHNPQKNWVPEATMRFHYIILGTVYIKKGPHIFRLPL
ncbi:hypothetical protein HPB48_021800 [Haemaphysalis longicornis]|uniref:Cytochrome c oxidase subunit n=1 Tax=Haemaphysalis longicornis TaxID=44386 RepID=A0A9J6GBR2_HAELO|nr:hypothetical protein HPB48_021800 [Haemaphysalis longicornis]